MKSAVLVLRYVIGAWLWMLAAYAAFAVQDVLGALLIGIVAWALWPRRRRKQRGHAERDDAGESQTN